MSAVVAVKYCIYRKRCPRAKAEFAGMDYFPANMAFPTMAANGVYLWGGVVADPILLRRLPSREY